ncbi:hypothetical protein AKH21_01665, partial [Pelagibacteraceae bacterium GOM-A5]
LLKLNNIGTKNLPDAIKWHFASYWKHAVSKKEIFKIKKSLKKIEKHIAIPILIKNKISIYDDIAKKIIKL